MNSEEIVKVDKYSTFQFSDDEDIKIKVNSENKFVYEFKNEFLNIIGLSIKIKKVSEGGSLTFQLLDDKNNLLQHSTKDISSIKDNQWNEIKINPIFGKNNKVLKLVIKTNPTGEVILFKNNFETLCLQVTYENFHINTLQNVTETIKELETIYESSGWKFLLKLYKLRDRLGKIVLITKTILKLFSMVNTNNLKKSQNYLKDNGLRAFLSVVKSKFSMKNKGIIAFYNDYVRKNSLTEEEKDRQRFHKFKIEPMISIVVPTFNTPKQFLIEMIESVIDQTYYKWELCIADGDSKLPHVAEILEDYKKKYPNIKVKYLSENLGIAENTNEALSIATGDFISLFDHDDLLTEDALFEIVKAINENPKAELIYTDEDKTDEHGKRFFDPHFKPDWSPDSFRSCNYICHFTTIKRTVIEKIVGFIGDYNGSQDYDIILRAAEVAEQIVHIPKVVYHWRVHSASTAGNSSQKLYAYESAVKALDDHIIRKGIKGKARLTKKHGLYQINYDLSKNPLVSIIIPNRDNSKTISKCINSIINKTTYTNYEIVIVENNSVEKETFDFYEKLKKYSSIKVVHYQGEFNYSLINNFGVKNCDGEVIVLLNNDTEVITNNWIQDMLQHAIREEVGAVGPKLYYGDNTIQNAGIILGLNGTFGNIHKGFEYNNPGYFGRLTIVQNFSAVSGACMMTRRELYEEVNGFDENYKFAYSDVDYCLKLRELGKVIVWTPFAELYHYEGKSSEFINENEAEEKLKEEAVIFKGKWNQYYEKGDPYYNANLSLSSDDYSLRL